MANLYTYRLVRDAKLIECPDRITSAAEAARIMRHLNSLDVEQVWVVAVDCRQRVLGASMVSSGTVDACLLVGRDVFRYAIQVAAWGIYLYHNHPSGDPSPSEADTEGTVALARGAELLGIRFCDHIIIGEGERYFSYREASEV